MDSQRATRQRDAAGNGVGDGTEAFDEQKAREGARLMLEAVGRDPDEKGLRDTWSRRVPATLEALTRGMRTEAKPTMRTFDARSEGIVMKTDIPVYSLCEHHVLPFHGKASIAYRPDEEMVGLSKLVRYVRWQSRRLTTQEQLTRDIADGLDRELDPGCVAVEVTATHMCEAMRGVETATETTTREAVGELTDREWRRFRDAIDD